MGYNTPDKNNNVVDGNSTSVDCKNTLFGAQEFRTSANTTRGLLTHAGDVSEGSCKNRAAAISQTVRAMARACAAGSGTEWSADFGSRRGPGDGKRTSLLIGFCNQSLAWDFFFAAAIICCSTI